MFKNPTVSDIVIKQDQNVSTNLYRHNCCGRDVSAPKWNYTSPTLELEQKGLTLNALTSIIHTINNNAAKDYEDHYNHKDGRYIIVPSVGIGLGYVTCMLTLCESVVKDRTIKRIMIIVGAAIMIISVIALVCIDGFILFLSFL